MQKIWKQTHREERKAKAKIYKASIKYKLAASKYNRAYYAAHREQLLAYQKAYRDKKQLEKQQLKAKENEKFNTIHTGEPEVQ